MCLCIFTMFPCMLLTRRANCAVAPRSVPLPRLRCALLPRGAGRYTPPWLFILLRAVLPPCAVFPPRPPRAGALLWERFLLVLVSSGRFGPAFCVFSGGCEAGFSARGLPRVATLRGFCSWNLVSRLGEPNCFEVRITSYIHCFEVKHNHIPLCASED